MRLHLGGRRRRDDAASTATSSAPRAVVLIVDDGGGAGAVRRVAGRLGSTDWTVQVVRTAAEAAATGGRVDGVLLSLDGVDDATAACTAVRAGEDRFVVVVTPSPSSQDCIRVLDAGADEYLPASIPAEELRLRLRNLLRHRGPAAGAPCRDAVPGSGATAR
jgi:DNA-binding response OmpR family regulator